MGSSSSKFKEEKEVYIAQGKAKVQSSFYWRIEGFCTLREKIRKCVKGKKRQLPQKGMKLRQVRWTGTAKTSKNLLTESRWS